MAVDASIKSDHVVGGCGMDNSQCGIAHPQELPTLTSSLIGT
jgi:hypothetical protein